MEASRLYTEILNEGLPIYGLEEVEAIAKMKQAATTGKKMTEGAEVNASKWVLIS